MKTLVLLVVLTLAVLAAGQRRGRTRTRTKSKFQLGLPITGKYRDPESDRYYNNNDVSKYFLIRLKKWCSNIYKYMANNLRSTHYIF